MVLACVFGCSASSEKADPVGGGGTAGGTAEQGEDGGTGNGGTGNGGTGNDGTAGSGDVESTDIATRSLYAGMDVVAAGDGETSVTVLLAVGDDAGPYVVLTSGDALTATNGDTERRLTFSSGRYRTSFPNDDAGTEYTLALVAGGAGLNAPSSVVTMPERVQTDGAGYDQTVSRADGELVLTWPSSDSSEGALSWTILDSDCLWETEGTMPDSGELRLGGADFDVKPSAEAAQDDPADPSETCSAVVCLSRTAEGTLDPALADHAGGYIRAVQRTCIEFVSEP
jgi:hypothetical protein